MSSTGVHPSPQVLSQIIEGETVLLHLEAERYFVLDTATGTRCWQLLGEHGDVEQTILTMLREFDIDEQTLRADVEGLVAQLRAAGLVLDTAA